MRSFSIRLWVGAGLVEIGRTSAGTAVDLLYLESSRWCWAYSARGRVKDSDCRLRNFDSGCDRKGSLTGEMGANPISGLFTRAYGSFNHTFLAAGFPAFQQSPLVGIFLCVSCPPRDDAAICCHCAATVVEPNPQPARGALFGTSVHS